MQTTRNPHWYRMGAGSYRSGPTTTGSRFYAKRFHRIWEFGTRIDGDEVRFGVAETFADVKAQVARDYGNMTVGQLRARTAEVIAGLPT